MIERRFFSGASDERWPARKASRIALASRPGKAKLWGERWGTKWPCQHCNQLIKTIEWLRITISKLDDRIDASIGNFAVGTVDMSKSKTGPSKSVVAPPVLSPGVWTGRWRRLPSFALLGAVILVVYGRSLRDPFIFDDETTIANNPSIVRLWPLLGDAQQPGPLNPPRELTTSGRPLVNLTVALNYYFGGVDPEGYHILNLVLHWISTLLLLVIVQRTLELEYFGERFQDSAELLALAVSLLWTVHPLQTETVVYITQRTELMVGFFYLSTLYACQRYWAASSPTSQRKWLILATLTCLAGMACKEVMVTAPVIVFLFERTFITGSFRRALKQSWPLYSGLVLGWGLLAGLNYQGPRSATAGFGLGISAYTYWLTQAKVLLMYFKLVVWPWPLIIHYEFPYLSSVAEAWPWLLPVLLLSLVTTVLLWQRSVVGFAGACVFIILSPTLFVPVTTEVAAERRMYIPLAAILAAVVAGGYAMTRRALELRADAAGRISKQRQLLKGTAVIVLAAAIALSLVSIRRLAAYDSPLVLWEDAALQQPDDPVIRNNLGTTLLGMHQDEDAKRQFERALKLSPRWTIAMRNVADALREMGRNQEAIGEYQRVLKISPDDYKSWNSLGGVFVKTGRFSEAIAAYEEATRQKPDYEEAYYNLGIVLCQLSRFEEAMPNYEKAIELKPSSAEAHYNLGLIFSNLGHLPEAADQWKQAVYFKPDYAEAHHNLGTVLSQLGRSEEAIEHYQQAIRLKPDLFEAYANLATTLAVLQRPTDAIAVAQMGIGQATAHHETAQAEQMKAWLANYRSEQTGQHTAPPSPADANHAVPKP
jgi:protein O-mannosyl-transferase